MRTGREIAAMSPEERLKLAEKKKRKKWTHVDRVQLSRDELKDFLRRHDARTSTRLARVRRPTDPNIYDYIRKFGSWSNAVAETFPGISRRARDPVPREPKPKRRKSRAGIKLKGRKAYTKAELRDYALAKGIRNIHRLKRVRRKKDPTVYDYEAKFGSWSKAMQYVWGKEVTTDFTALYILQYICWKDAYRLRRYRALRRKDPYVVPSVYVVIREYGAWSAARDAAKALGCKPAQNAFDALKKKLKRLPTYEDCVKHNVNVQVLVNLYGGVRKWESMTRWMESISEKQERSS